MNRFHGNQLALALATLLVLAAAPPAMACLEIPDNPPDVTISGDACIDGELEVRIHDYSTFAASNHACECALNLALLQGVVVGASVVESGTSNPVAVFNFADDPAVAFNPPADWQGFKTFVASVVSNVDVDLVFRVVPSKQRCEDYAETLAGNLRDPSGGFLIGTRGLTQDGKVIHEDVIPAGKVTVVTGKPDACDAGFNQPCGFDLVTGRMSESCRSTPGFDVTVPPTDSNGDGWLESVMRIKLADGCTRVCAVLDYTEQPSGFTFNLGDSSTNNGYGGNNGSPEAEAEVQINGETLTAFSVSFGSGQLDRPINQELALNNSSYKVCVSNQNVSYGQPSGRSSTPFGLELFALPDPVDGNSEVFLGLNRVIHNLTGGPSPSNRTGTGLRRAYVTVE